MKQNANWWGNYRKGDGQSVFFYDQGDTSVFNDNGKGRDCYEFTNFYVCKTTFDVQIGNYTYSTNCSEKLFQAAKFLNPDGSIANQQAFHAVLNAQTPRQAFDLASGGNGIYKNQIRSDWHQIKSGIMQQIVDAKFSQDPDCHDLLTKTKGLKLIENSPYDDQWGNGPQGTGKNLLGGALENTRYKLEQGILKANFKQQNQQINSNQQQWNNQQPNNTNNQNSQISYDNNNHVRFKATINDALRQQLGLQKFTETTIGQNGQLTFTCGGHSDALLLQQKLKEQGYTWTQGQNNAFTIDFNQQRNSYGFLKHQLKFNDNQILQLANSQGGNGLGVPQNLQNQQINLNQQITPNQQPNHQQQQWNNQQNNTNNPPFNFNLQNNPQFQQISQSLQNQNMGYSGHVPNNTNNLSPTITPEPEACTLKSIGEAMKEKFGLQKAPEVSISGNQLKFKFHSSKDKKSSFSSSHNENVNNAVASDYDTAKDLLENAHHYKLSGGGIFSKNTLTIEHDKDRNNYGLLCHTLGFDDKSIYNFVKKGEGKKMYVYKDTMQRLENSHGNSLQK